MLLIKTVRVPEREYAHLCVRVRKEYSCVQTYARNSFMRVWSACVRICTSERVNSRFGTLRPLRGPSSRAQIKNKPKVNVDPTEALIQARKRASFGVEPAAAWVLGRERV